MWWNFSIYPGWYSNLSRQSVSVSLSLSDFHSVGVLDPYRVFRDHRMLCIFWYGVNKLFLISKKCDKFWSRDINFTHGFDPNVLVQVSFPNCFAVLSCFWSEVTRNLASRICFWKHYHAASGGPTSAIFATIYGVCSDPSYQNEHTPITIQNMSN